MMNYHKNRDFKRTPTQGKTLDEPQIREWKTKIYSSGVYIISRGEKDPQMKLGLSTNLMIE